MVMILESLEYQNPGTASYAALRFVTGADSSSLHDVSGISKVAFFFLVVLTTSNIHYYKANKWDISFW